MSIIHLLYPQENESVPFSQIKLLLHPINTESHNLSSYQNEVLSFLSSLSNAIGISPASRQHPELMALAFWYRSFSLKELPHFQTNTQPDVRQVPCGIVFQIPPSNVPLLFGYTFAISLFCGNKTCIRLSRTKSKVQDHFLSILKSTLASTSRHIQERIIILRYDRDDKITEELSKYSHLRLVWGGDATVSHVATIPMPPRSRHIGFGDRYSLAALNMNSYVASTEEKKNRVASLFATDLTLYHQLACSSPRLMCWIGDNQLLETVPDDFYNRVIIAAEKKGYVAQANECVARQNAAFLMIADGLVKKYKSYGTTLTTLTMTVNSRLSELRFIPYGYGLLAETWFKNLTDIIPSLHPKDQTLALWGFSEETIEDFVVGSFAPMIDRIVPFGQTLAFDTIWDGLDLFDLMTRKIPLPHLLEDK